MWMQIAKRLWKVVKLPKPLSQRHICIHRKKSSNPSGCWWLVSPGAADAGHEERLEADAAPEVGQVEQHLRTGAQVAALARGQLRRGAAGRRTLLSALLRHRGALLRHRLGSGDGRRRLLAKARVQRVGRSAQPTQTVLGQQPVHDWPGQRPQRAGHVRAQHAVAGQHQRALDQLLEEAARVARPVTTSIAV